MFNSASFRSNGGVDSDALNDSIGWLVRFVEGCSRIAQNPSAELSPGGPGAWWIWRSSHRVNRGRARRSNPLPHGNAPSSSTSTPTPSPRSCMHASRSLTGIANTTTCYGTPTSAKRVGLNAVTTSSAANSTGCQSGPERKQGAGHHDPREAVFICSVGDKCNPRLQGDSHPVGDVSLVRRVWLVDCCRQRASVFLK